MTVARRARDIAESLALGEDDRGLAARSSALADAAQLLQSAIKWVRLSAV